MKMMFVITILVVVTSLKFIASCLVSVNDIGSILAKTQVKLSRKIVAESDRRESSDQYVSDPELQLNT